MGNRHTRCCGFILNETNELLLIEQYSRDNSTYWWLPGGGLEPGEKPEDGIRREIMEELGAEMDIHDMFTMKNSNGARTYKDYVVAVASLKTNQKMKIGTHEMDGIVGYKWFQIENDSAYDPIVLDRDILPFIIEVKKRPVWAALQSRNGA